MNPLQIDKVQTATDSPVIVALDFPTKKLAVDFIRQLNPRICKLKIGNELFTTTGRLFVESIINQGFQVFLDLKYHDIPNTVQQACKVAADMGVWMINMHTSGGSKMMEAAANGIANLAHKPLLIGVTILTSMNETDLNELGVFTQTIATQILHLASLAQQSGLNGVVCSAQEVNLLKKELGKNFLTVTPGIRLTTTNNLDDQKRVMTPRQAFVEGADYIVIGRPITQAQDPLSVIYNINSIHQTIRKDSLTHQ